MIPFDTFTSLVQTQFGGVLTHGSHTPDGSACLLEAAHAALGEVWSDTPDHWPDLRALNDGPWTSDAARTAALIPVLQAYWEWRTWSLARQQTVLARIIVLTINRLIADLPGLPNYVACACREARTLYEAEQAAEAAGRAAGWAAGRVVLQQACLLWIEAAQEGADE